ncbi:Fic family protein [Halobacteriovorax sp. GB3]|uniref:Fic family protein n=1 Tax=Halobacteriovorax sp. GB3 TaxID=2719615 RepID=UPI00235E2C2F|nr:Fic family protein [Halobacteriovorax sp. GB3]MDD0852168.1 Fic family protein [Halobacteriovorax sp. GB3]
MDSSEVLKYLQAPLDLRAQEEIEAQYDFISYQCEKVSRAYSLNWSKLAKARLLSSNTLGRVKDSDLRNWDRANQYVNESLSQNEELSLSHVYKLNALVRNEASSIREIPIYGGHLEFIKPEYIEKALSLFEKKILTNLTLSPYEKAFHIYQWIVTIHPFHDGNGRTSRLCSDYVLLGSGILPISFPSSFSSHVCQNINEKRRNKEDCYLSFLKAISHSYEILLGE